jgi:hypothetical protein
MPGVQVLGIGSLLDGMDLQLSRGMPRYRMKASGNLFLNVRFIEREPFGFVPKVICV